MKNNSYTRTVAQINAGGSADELSQSLAAVVKAVKATGKKGRITYTLDVAPASRGDVVAVKLTDDIKVTMPKLSRPESIFFSTDDGSLQRNDPRQNEMVLTVAEAVEKPAAVANAVNS